MATFQILANSLYQHLPAGFGNFDREEARFEKTRKFLTKSMKLGQNVQRRNRAETNNIL